MNSASLSALKVARAVKVVECEGEEGGEEGFKD